MTAMTEPNNHDVSADGTMLTDEVLERIAAEADVGYDVDEMLKCRRQGRPPVSSSPAVVIPRAITKSGDNEMTEGAIVPFGKHKGQRVEVLLADPGYREWILAQPWVRDRYPVFHQTIINYGGEPANTPEHNEMQAAFLNEESCLRLAQLLCPSDVGPPGALQVLQESQYAAMVKRFEANLTVETKPALPSHLRFEDEGWDVTFWVYPARTVITAVSLPDCACGPCDHDCHDDPDGYHCSSQCPWKDRALVAFFFKRDRDSGSYNVKEYQRHTVARPALSIRVELKPDLGDDFPTVLRQVQRYPYHDNVDYRCVVVRRHGFATLTWDQVRSMFEASDVKLLHEADLELPMTSAPGEALS